MKNRTLLVSALALVAAQGIAQAAPSNTDAAQAWAQRLSVAGVTVRPGDLPPAPVSATPEAQSTDAYAQRLLSQAGVTVRPGTSPAATVQQTASGNSEARVQKRLSLIGLPTDAYVAQPLVQAGY